MLPLNFNNQKDLKLIGFKKNWFFSEILHIYIFHLNKLW